VEAIVGIERTAHEPAGELGHPTRAVAVEAGPTESIQPRGREGIGPFGLGMPPAHPTTRAQRQAAILTAQPHLGNRRVADALVQRNGPPEPSSSNPLLMGMDARFSSVRPPRREDPGPEARSTATTQKRSDMVPGGYVHVVTNLEKRPRQDVFERHHRPGYPNYYQAGAFAIGYEGEQAADSGWLQFAWADVEVTAVDGTKRKLADRGIATSNGQMDLTTDPNMPNYKIDSNPATSETPFYEDDDGTMARTPSATTIFDAPTGLREIAQREHAAGAKKVVVRHRFDTFLVRASQAIYQVSLLLTWEYTFTDSPRRTQEIVHTGAVAGLPPAMKRQLVEEFPRCWHFR
jgi:hypothetical protein